MYEQMKKLAKQHKSDEKELEVFKTGGGNYILKVTSHDDKVLSMLEENFFTIPNNFDSNTAENVAGPSRIQPMMVDIGNRNENIMIELVILLFTIAVLAPLDSNLVPNGAAAALAAGCYCSCWITTSLLSMLAGMDCHNNPICFIKKA
ncbi:unnamed protein product [Psylliodes chrysocephalus]|uniref:Uncharacterized protein n=1 Tax=Psylliodes chrysocephalus TaxID=3402493 RepID=A0A9P0DDG2_9CUCU|nr:unnamed protein product [Psylliodes chrysocephala]